MGRVGGSGNASVGESSDGDESGEGKSKLSRKRGRDQKGMYTRKRVMHFCQKTVMFHKRAKQKCPNIQQTSFK